MRIGAAKEHTLVKLPQSTQEYLTSFPPIARGGLHAFVHAVDDSEDSAFNSIQHHLEKQSFMEDKIVGFLEINKRNEQFLFFSPELYIYTYIRIRIQI